LIVSLIVDLIVSVTRYRVVKFYPHRFPP